MKINPEVGASQATIFRQYKLALMREIALDRATRTEEKLARKENRRIEPDNIERPTKEYLEYIPYKTIACRYNSFKTYFSDLKLLGWGEYTNTPFLNHRSSGLPRLALVWGI